MKVLKELQKTILLYLNNFWTVLKDKDKKELDEALIKQGKSEKEKALIAEQCAEIDLEHDLMEELLTSKEDPGTWMEKKVEEIVREINPDATREEIESVTNSVADSMEREIGEQADELAEEASEIVKAIGKTTLREE